MHDGPIGGFAATLSPAILQAWLGEAFRCLQAGRLPEAEALCRQVLACDPSHAAALHLLGLIAQQTGQHETALALIGQAIDCNPDDPTYYNNLGNVLQDLGRSEDAAARYGQALARRPDYALAHVNLGNALKRLGRSAEAADHFRQAIALQPGSAQAHNGLGAVLLADGNIAAAIEHLRQALALRPDSADTHNNLGLALHQQGDEAAAVAQYRRAIELRPRVAQVHNNLGNALLAQGETDAATEEYRQALALDPDYAEAHNNLGTLLQEQGRTADAKPHFHRALAVQPDYASAHNNLGNALLAEGNFTAAIACYRRAVALQPDYAQAFHNLSIALEEYGDLAEAQRACEAAVALSPRSARYYRTLVGIRPATRGDSILTAMERLAGEMSTLPLADQVELSFALGRAYEQIGDTEQAIRYLLAANARHRSRIGYDEQAMLRYIGGVRDAFPSALVQGRRGLGHDSAVPVFIIGMPRSGTTLVEQILASHPAVHGGGERQDFGRLANEALGAEGPPGQVAALPAAALRQLGADYVQAIAADAPGAMRITDKMPGNFVYAGLIHLALPNARIIHVSRDPLDTCFSCFAILFAAGQPQSYEQAELGRYYRAYAALMQHWRDVLPSGVMLEVRYEDVVADMEREARRIVAHCGLPWDPACLAFHTTQRPVRTASARQVRRPVYRSSIGRSRAYAAWLQPLIAALGDLAAGPEGLTQNNRVS